MSILLPLGLLGLIGIAVLILIYILKPNYQQKLVSSTYIWELSLKYRKKKIPVSRLRNLIILGAAGNPRGGNGKQRKDCRHRRFGGYAGKRRRGFSLCARG